MATDLTFTIVELRSGMRVARMAKATDEVADELADELVTQRLLMSSLMISSQCDQKADSASLSEMCRQQLCQ